MILIKFLFIWLVYCPITVYALHDNSSLEILPPQHIWFSGYEWEVKAGRYYPGKNNWAKDNVWVDDKGYLHLKISQHAGQWYCAELATVRRFGYGVYQFQVIGQVDKLDPNMVLGLFVYPGEETGFNEKNEIDIEFAQWGKKDAPRGNYTVTPDTHPFLFSLEGNYTVHQFTWDKQQVLFQSFHGHAPNENQEISNWLYIPEQYKKTAPVPPVRVHMNFWLYLGHPPSDGQEREIVIRKFVFIN